MTKRETIEWLDELISKGKELVQESIASDSYSVHTPKYVRFRRDSIRFLENLFGKGSAEACDFDSNVNSPTRTYVETGCELLQGYRDDIVKDRLSIAGLISHRIFMDMLAIGNHLYNEKLDFAAAVTIGGVLEEHLRQLALKLGIPVLTGTKYKKANLLAEDLKKAGIYDETERKHIEYLLGMRNDAAHPPFKADHKDIMKMSDEVREFIAKYPL